MPGEVREVVDPAQSRLRLNRGFVDLLRSKLVEVCLASMYKKVREVQPDEEAVHYIDF